jgi:hypothetical protein
MSCTPPWTTWAPVLRKAAYTWRKRRGCTSSSASNTPVMRPAHSSSAALSARGLFFTTETSVTTRIRSGQRVAADRATADVSGSSLPTTTRTSYLGWSRWASLRRVAPSTAASRRAGTISEKLSAGSLVSSSGPVKPVPSRTSGERRAWSIHHSVTAATRNSTTERARMAAIVSTVEYLACGSVRGCCVSQRLLQVLRGPEAAGHWSRQRPAAPVGPSGRRAVPCRLRLRAGVREHRGELLPGACWNCVCPRRSGAIRPPLPGTMRRQVANSQVSLRSRDDLFSLRGGARVRRRSWKGDGTSSFSGSAHRHP